MCQRLPYLTKRLKIISSCLVANLWYLLYSSRPSPLFACSPTRAGCTPPSQQRAKRRWPGHTRAEQILAETGAKGWSYAATSEGVSVGRALAIDVFGEPNTNIIVTGITSGSRAYPSGERATFPLNVGGALQRTDGGTGVVKVRFIVL